jgi:hypothetical protein
MNLGGRAGRVLRSVGAGACVTGCVMGAAVVTAIPAAADGGLGEKGTTRYVVSDTGTPISVSTVLTVTNQTPSSGNRYFVYTGYRLWLPHSAVNLKASSNGAAMSARVIKQDGFNFAELRFPSSLAYGRSRTITVTYSIKGAAPRSKESGRVGKGFAAFDVYSPGDDDQATIEVSSPRWMTLDVPEDYTEETSGDTRIATLTGGGHAGLGTSVSLRDPSQVAMKKVPVGKTSFTVVSFPGDSTWSSFIAGKLPATVTELQRLTGQPWPNASTAINEDYSQQVYGWDGLYDNGSIEVAETLDHALLAHELGHAWANYDHMDERWLVEGVAQELATQTMVTLKGKDAPHEAVTATQKGSFPLTTWPDGDGKATAAEDYGYPASWKVVHALMAGTTPATRTDVLRALTSSRSLYDVAGDRTVANHPTTWHQAYDAFEVVGGNKGTRALMTTWVVGADGTKILTARDEARAAYASQDQLNGDWSLPRGVRSAMYDWNFAESARQLALTGGLGAKAVQAQKAAAAAHLGVTAVRSAYQQADDSTEYRAVDFQLGNFTAQAGRYNTLRHDVAHPGPLARLGAVFVDPASAVDDSKAVVEKGDIVAAQKALNAAQDRVTWTGRAGAGFLAALLVLALAALGAVRLRGRRRRARASQSASAGEGLEGLEASATTRHTAAAATAAGQPRERDHDFTTS